MVECFNEISSDPDCRVVLVSAAGKIFTAGGFHTVVLDGCRLCFYRLCCVAGIDLMDLSGEILQPKGDDVARISWNLRQMIVKFQETFSVIEKVRRCELFFPLN